MAPSDYRSISISSAITQALHRILARRINANIKLSPLQYTFLQKDRYLEASSLVHAILRRAHDNTQQVAMAFLDLAKAFDTVSHEAVLDAARNSGIPSPLLRYLEQLYDNTTVCLSGTSIKCGRGVRQGDRLSPVLFILVMDRAVKAAIPNLGVRLGGNKINALAYADDLVHLLNALKDSKRNWMD